MNEIRLAHQPAADATREQTPQTRDGAGGNEIRLLDDLELALAGGGDQIVNWP